MTPDLLTLRDIDVRTRIGITDDERKVEQRLFVTIECAVDARGVARGDDLDAGIDYAKICDAVRAAAATQRRTIERFAEDLAAMLIADFSLPSVTVTVVKFPAIGLRQAEIRITRP